MDYKNKGFFPYLIMTSSFLFLFLIFYSAFSLPSEVKRENLFENMNQRIEVEEKADFYVSPEEEDSIQKALEKAQPGQTICLSPGVYHQDIRSVRNGTLSAPITIEGPADAVIKGAGASRVIEINHDYLTLKGFTVDGLHGSPSSKSGYRDMLLYAVGNQPNDGVTGLKILNMNFRNAGGECIRLKYFAKNNEIAYNNIQNCGVYDFRFKAGGKNGEGIYIGTAPEQLSKNPTSDLDASNNNHIHHNTINTQGNEGVDIKEGSEHNLVEYNKITGQKDPESAGLDSRGDNNIFRYNEVSGSEGAGIRFGGDDYQGRVFGKNNSAYQNQLSNNKYGAIKIQVEPQGMICGNELAGNGADAGTYGKNYNFTAECAGLPASDPVLPAPIPDPVDPEPGDQPENPSCRWVLVCDGEPAETPSSGELNILSVSASSYDSRDGGQVPGNTLDKNLETRWSAEGMEEWIKYDLGSVKNISYLKIAFHRGNERAQGLEIQVSEDGKIWAGVFSGESNGRTLDLQKFDFTDKKARYIKIIGLGNTQNNWNSLTEVEIY